MKIETTPRGLLNVFFRQRLKFVLTFLLVLAAAAAYISTAKPTYLSAGSLLMKFGQGATPDISRPNDRPSEVSQNDRREIMQSNNEILLSHDLLMTLVKEFGAEKIYPDIGQRAKGEPPMEVAIHTLQVSDIMVRIGQQSNVIDVSMLNRDPILARDMLHRLFELFIARHSEMYNAPQTGFMLDQVARAKEKLETSQNALKAFKTKNGISSIEEESSQLLRDKGEASTVGLESIDTAQEKLADLKSKEAELLSTYRADSPVVKQIRENISLARKELNRRQADLRSRKGEDGMLGPHVSQINRRMQELESQRSAYNDLFRQVQIDEENYKNYQLRSEEARVNDILNQKSITRVSVLDEPVAAMKPARPRKKLVLAMSLLFGLLLASSLVLASELMDERFTTPKHLEEALDVPVLAVFSKGAV